MTSPILTMPILNGRVRGVDERGSGAFAAPRGTRLHRGIDIECELNSLVRAPCSGTVKRWIYCYQDDPSFRGVAIECAWGEIRILYITPTVAAGSEVTKLDPIGVTQDITKRYPGITPHVHMGVRLKSETGALEAFGRSLTKSVWINPALLMGFY
jgi:hypothetical protein